MLLGVSAKTNRKINLAGRDKETVRPFLYLLSNIFILSLCLIKGLNFCIGAVISQENLVILKYLDFVEGSHKLKIQNSKFKIIEVSPEVLFNGVYPCRDND